MTHPEAKRVHDEAIVIDATCPLMRDPNYISWWVDGGVTAAAPTVGGHVGLHDTLTHIAMWLRLLDQRSDLLHVKSAADIERAKETGKFGIIFHLQGTAPIEDDLNLIDLFKQLGVGMIQLAYNEKNRVGDGCEERTDAGLSRFGLRAIERMNQARVIVDCSHTGYRTTMEAIEASRAPVVFSHANAKAVHDTRRNISDDQIKAIAATGGLIGAVGFPAFVSGTIPPTLDEFIDHIDYFVRLVGADHVGLGIDYFLGQDPIASLDEAERMYTEAIDSGMWQPENYPPPPWRYPTGIATPRDFLNFTSRLLERGYSEADVKKILGGNWLRVFRAVWGE